jgi:sigma-B regulation protein RsbU (phosphoserine phosphatase)
MNEPKRIFDVLGPNPEDQMRFVLDTMRDLSAASTPRDFVKTFGDHVGELIARDRMLVLSRHGVPEGHYLITRNSDWEDAPDPWSERHKLPLLKGGILGELIYGNEPRVINDFSASPDDPAYEYLSDAGAIMAAPQYQQREAMTLQVFLRKPGRPFEPEILPELVWTSNLFGIAVHNSRLGEELQRAYAIIDDELRVISELQQSLLPPHLPEIQGLELAVHYQTAQRAGGDYYDLFPLEGNRLGMLMADVSGHGAPAAVLMAITHSIARTFPESPSEPALFLNYLNEQLVNHYTNRSRAFVTAFYGVYDPAAHTLTYGNAGHPPPLVKHRSNDNVTALDLFNNLPLGVESEARHETGEFKLTPDDFLVMYTDGLTEARNPGGQLFLEDGLGAAVGRDWQSPHELVRGVLDAVSAFTQQSNADDDRTLLAARVK